MDFLKSQFDRIRLQLNGLSASQKMLTGALVTIMVMTLLYWGRYAGAPEFKPLLSQALSEEELTRITDQLDARGIEYRVGGDRTVLVPTERRIQILSALGFANLLPKSTAKGFDDVIKQMTPFDGNNRENQLFTRAKSMELTQVVRGFPGVADATVAIDPTTEREIGGRGKEATAFVNITMTAGTRPSKHLVNAAASVVSGAQAGLLMKNIKVVVDGVPQRVREDNSEEAAAGDAFDLREKEEARLTRKAADQLADIQGVMVAVTVAVSASSEQETSRTVPKVQSKERLIESRSSEQTGATPAPVEPAAGSNLGVALANVPSGDAGSTSESDEKTEFQHFPDVVEKTSRTPSGVTTPIGASVRVPRSYFARIAKGSGTAEPDDKAIRARMDEELPKIQETVRQIVGLKELAAVTVHPYFDQPVAPAAAQATTAAASALGFSVGGHAKEIALGALALVSLFMVSTIVKKGTPAPVAPRAAEPRPGPSILTAGEMLAGEAGEGNPLLDGMELDDESVRTQQMLSQVSTLVDDNPDAAAALVKRWLNRN